MAEFSSSTYSEVDANNNAAPPDGAPAGTFPNQSEGIWRATLGAVKRFWDRSNGTITTTGSAGSYVYTPANTAFPTAYVSGERYAFKANFTSVGGDTLNINTLGARPLVKAGGTGLTAIAAGDIQINQIVETQYNSTFGGSGAMQMVSPTAGTTTANPVSGGTPSIANHVPKYSDTTGLAITDGYAVGTASNSLVQLDGSGNLPAVGGSALTGLSSFPSGVILPYAGSATLSGWVFCDGSSLLVASFGSLFTAIGYTYGGSGANFSVPDLRGRVPAGKDNMNGSPAQNRITSGGSGITGTTLGAAGGVETTTLTTAQLASHSHTQAAATVLFTSAGISVGTACPISFSQGGTTATNGSGTAHQNTQPTIITNYIIKT